MLKILYDYQHFSEQRFGGISRYFSGIMDGINGADGMLFELSTLYTNNYHIKDLPHILSNSYADKFLNKKREIWLNQAYSKFKLRFAEYDIFHPTYYHPYFLDHVKKPIIVTVHDMIHEKFAESFLPNDPIANYKRKTVERADLLIAVSKATKHDLIKILNVPEDKIRVINHGIEENILRQKSLPKFDLPANYILYVGDRNKYKNFNRFAEALSRVIPGHRNLYLICAGGTKFSKEEVAHLQKLDIIHRVIRLNVTDLELKQLYDNAQLLVTPSLCEGFGYPLLEAFNSGCAVAASNITSTEEVAGDAVQYFDPYQVEDIYRAVTSVLNNPQLRNELIAKGYERVKAFPLGKQLTETFNCYRELAK